MNLDLLTAISPIDGRYRGKTEQLANYFSEYAEVVTPFVQVGTYPTRNFATLGPL